MAKIYYTKHNPLIVEWEDYIEKSEDEYIEIPCEVVEIEKMSTFAKEKGGILFYPTASINDLKNCDSTELERVLANGISLPKQILS